MVDDMNVRRFTPDTQRDYIRAVKKLAGAVRPTPRLPKTCVHSNCT
jgi:hypothetical protein